MSESDVCRRQILTYNDDPRAEKIKIFLPAVGYTFNIVIQMNRKEQTKIIVKILN